MRNRFGILVSFLAFLTCDAYAMTLIDSEAAFKQRCTELSTATLNLHVLLRAQNISCLSELAFACGAPNKAPTDDEFRAFTTSVLGAGFTAGQQSVLRRINFEAATFVLSQLKSSVTGDAADGAKKRVVYLFTNVLGSRTSSNNVVTFWLKLASMFACFFFVYPGFVHDTVFSSR